MSDKEIDSFLVEGTEAFTAASLKKEQCDRSKAYFFSRLSELFTVVRYLWI